MVVRSQVQDSSMHANCGTGRYQHAQWRRTHSLGDVRRNLAKQSSTLAILIMDNLFIFSFCLEFFAFANCFHKSNLRNLSVSKNICNVHGHVCICVHGSVTCAECMSKANIRISNSTFISSNSFSASVSLSAGIHLFD